MPTYDYECSACGHKFELFQSITDAVKKKCPQCGKPRLKRLFGTGAAVMFKGSGFYQTDYRSDSYKKAATADKGGTGGDGKSGETKAGGVAAGGDSKPAASGAPSSAGSKKEAKAKKH